jgi:hypothetical protein
MHSGETLAVIVDYRLVHDAMRKVGTHDVFFVNNWFPAPLSVDSDALMRPYIESIQMELRALVREHASSTHKHIMISVHIAELDLDSRLAVQSCLCQNMAGLEIGCHSSLDAANDFVRLVCGNHYFPTPGAWASTDFRTLLMQVPTEDVEALLCLTSRRARGDENSFFEIVQELMRQMSRKEINADDIAQTVEGLCLVTREATSTIAPLKEKIAGTHDAVLIRAIVAELISIVAPKLWHNT